MKRCVMRRAFCTHTYRVRLPFVFVHEPAAHTHTSGEELRKRGEEEIDTIWPQEEDGFNARQTPDSSTHT